MALDDILRKAAIVGICTKLVLGTPNISNSDNLHHNPFQPATAQAASLEDTTEKYSQHIKKVTDETYEEKVYNSGKVTVVLFNIEQTKNRRQEQLRKTAIITLNRLVEAYNEDINFLLYAVTKDKIKTNREVRKEINRLTDIYAVGCLPALALYKEDGTVMEILPGGTVKKLREKDLQWYIDAFNPAKFNSYKSLSVEEYKAGVKKRLGIK